MLFRSGTETVAFGEAVKAEKSLDMCARDAPDIERQIERFGVLSLCRKAAAHFLHTVCTFARIGGFSAQGLHSLLSSAYSRFPVKTAQSNLFSSPSHRYETPGSDRAGFLE